MGVYQPNNAWLKLKLTMKITLVKTKGVLCGADDESVEAINKIKPSIPFVAEFKTRRNSKFHRKFWALINVAYARWEPEFYEGAEYHGFKVIKNLEQFRKDLIILTGHYEATFTLNGTMRLVAKSISFKSMTQEEFEALYNSVVNVILDKVLTNYTQDDLDNVVNELLSFS